MAIRRVGFITEEVASTIPVYLLGEDSHLLHEIEHLLPSVVPDLQPVWLHPPEMKREKGVVGGHKSGEEGASQEYDESWDRFTSTLAPPQLVVWILPPTHDSKDWFTPLEELHESNLRVVEYLSRRFLSKTVVIASVEHRADHARLSKIGQTSVLTLHPWPRIPDREGVKNIIHHALLDKGGEFEREFFIQDNGVESVEEVEGVEGDEGPHQNLSTKGENGLKEGVVRGEDEVGVENEVVGLKNKKDLPIAVSLPLFSHLPQERNISPSSKTAVAVGKEPLAQPSTALVGPPTLTNLEVRVKPVEVLQISQTQISFTDSKTPLTQIDQSGEAQTRQTYSERADSETPQKPRSSGLSREPTVPKRVRVIRSLPPQEDVVLQSRVIQDDVWTHAASVFGNVGVVASEQLESQALDGRQGSGGWEEAPGSEKSLFSTASNVLRLPKIFGKKPRFPTLVIAMIGIVILLASAVAGVLSLSKLAEQEMRSVALRFTSMVSQDAKQTLNEDDEGEAKINFLPWYAKYQNLIAPVVTAIGDPLSYQGVLREIEVVEKYAVEIERQALFDAHVETAFRVVMGIESGDPIALMEDLQIKAEALQRSLGEVSSLVRDQGVNGVQGVYEPEKLDQDLSKRRAQLLKTQYFLDVLPDLLGASNKKTIALLVQNPQELRSSGGFIESLVLITADKGYVLDIQVQDVTIVDGQLRGAVEPPEDLKRFLGEERWYLRDVNWDPSFPQIAQQAGWFIEKQLGRPVDVVASIHASSLRELLYVLGPIDIAGEPITPDNMLDRLFQNSELVFPKQNSEQRKSFLSSIMSEVVRRIQTPQDDIIIPVVRKVFEEIADGQLLISSLTPDEERSLYLLNFNGEVYQPPCPQVFSSQSCVVETVYHLDSNIGVNRANASIEREIRHEVDVSRSGADHVYRVRYSNTATSSVWPSGTYKNYMRLVLPDYAVVGEVIVGDRVVEKDDRYSQLVRSKQIVGFVMEVPAGSTVEVVVRYRSGFAVADGGFSYALFAQQQPGVEDARASVVFRLAPNLRVVKLAPEARVSDRVLEYEVLGQEHRFFAVEMQ